MQQLYSGNGPMKVFWMFSGGASSLRATLDDPNNGKLYANAGAYYDKEDAKGVKLCKEHDVPHFHVSRRDFYRQHGLDPSDPESRRRFYGTLTERIDRDFSPDLICLSGYMHIVTDPFLGYRTILNIHPADLTILTGPSVSRLDASQISSADARELVRANKLTRKFKGENTVFDAVYACEPATRSTVHIATKEFDEGPIVVQSKAFGIDPGLIEQISRQHVMDGAPEYASTLQERMKTEGDGPAYLAALRWISEGRLARDGDTISLNGSELLYCGWRLG